MMAQTVCLYIFLMCELKAFPGSPETLSFYTIALANSTENKQPCVTFLDDAGAVLHPYGYSICV